MLDRIINIFKPLIDLWQRLPIRVRGNIVILIPLIAIIASTTLAFIGNSERSRTETAMQRHLMMSSDLSDILTLMVNAETGMRGYLLTQRKEFIKPFDIASKKLPKTMNHLLSLAESEPGIEQRIRKQSLFRELNSLSNQLMSELITLKKYASADDKSKNILYNHLLTGKKLMDNIRKKLASIQREEEKLLTERIEDINKIRKRDYIAIFVTLIIAVITRIVLWNIFNNGLIKRIKQVLDNVRSLKNGNGVLHQPSGKDDELGNLENEILSLSESNEITT